MDRFELWMLAAGCLAIVLFAIGLLVGLVSLGID